ncbi:MAG: TlpA family protein disulfide reductase [Gammaproteobacteria bacterium]|nr:TlpA family protein disulfide reductase [Gammaproteobacteria bacterium]MDH5736155.1 TlpA family protein disulfide reductase [Gammaproteobacteria bacterium]
MILKNFRLPHNIFSIAHIFAAIISVSCIAFATHATPGEVRTGEILTDTPMQGLTGHSLLLSDYRGKPLIINVWASYCTPCLSEMGSLERLKQHFSNDLNLIGISIDDYPERARRFLSKANTTFPHYIDHKLRLETMLGASSIPLTVLIDAQGRVLTKVNGSREWDSPDIIEAIGKMFNIGM